MRSLSLFRSLSVILALPLYKFTANEVHEMRARARVRARVSLPLMSPSLASGFWLLSALADGFARWKF